MRTDFHKHNDTDKIWWAIDSECVVVAYFSFGKKKVYELNKDYPQNLTKKEKEIFDKENPWYER